MVEGLEVVIKYHGAKYNRVSSPATASSEFAILKKDLAHLRVHSPSQKNVRRVKGSFILHWPTAGTSPKLDGLADSLHTRWFKLCSEDPEALKLRDFLSIESITLTQEQVAFLLTCYPADPTTRVLHLSGVLIRSTTQRDQTARDALPGTLTESTSDSSSGAAQQPVQVPALTHTLPAKPLPPPRVPPIAPRSDRKPASLAKRRMSSIEGPTSSPIRQKLDMSETQCTSPGLGSTDMPIQTNRTPTSPESDLPQRRSTTPRDVAKPTREDGPPDQLLSRESARTTPTSEWGSGPRPPSPAAVSGPAPATAFETTPVPTPTSAFAIAPAPAPVPIAALPDPSSAPSGVGDISLLMRRLSDTRSMLATMQRQERAILEQLENLGAPPVDAYLGPGGNGGGKGDRNDAEGALRDEVSRLEGEVKAERARRTRAERALSDVERECRAPFVVPALFQAFMNISELSS